MGFLSQSWKHFYQVAEKDCTDWHSQQQEVKVSTSSHALPLWQIKTLSLFGGLAIFFNSEVKNFFIFINQFYFFFSDSLAMPSAQSSSETFIMYLFICKMKKIFTQVILLNLRIVMRWVAVRIKGLTSMILVLRVIISIFITTFTYNKARIYLKKDRFSEKVNIYSPQQA